MRIPMFGFALLAFLLLAVVLAVAVFFAFRSGEHGKTKLSGCAGCAVALGLAFVAGLGALGLAVVSLLNVKTEWIRHGPVKSAEFEWRDTTQGPDGRGTGAIEAPVRLRLELRGGMDEQDFMKWLRRETSAETMIGVHEEEAASGERVTVVELTLPTSDHARRDLARARRELEKALPDLRLPTGARIEFKGPDD